jgi:hypothetical protein
MAPKTCLYPAVFTEPVSDRFVDRLNMSTPFENTGFTPSAGFGRERRTTALAELLAIAGLALSTIIVATVVSVGIARANVAGDVVGHEGSVFGVALVLGLLFLAMGGLTVFSLPSQEPKKH